MSRQHQFLPGNDLLRFAMVALVAALALAPAAAAQAASPFRTVDRSAATLPPGFAGTEPEAFYWKLPEDVPGIGESDEAFQARVAPKRAPFAGTFAFTLRLRTAAGTGEPCEWLAGYDEAGTRLVVTTAVVAEKRVCLSYTMNKPPFAKGGGAPVAAGQTERKDKAFRLRVLDDGDAKSPGPLAPGAELRLAVAGVAPDRAKRLLQGGDLRAVVVADTTGAADVDLDRIEQGPESAVEVWVRAYTIVVRRPEIWLYDRKSGEILLKQAL